MLRRVLARNLSVLAVDTGQHYDHALNALLYEQLGVAPPDRFLEVGSAGHAAQTAAILTRTDELLAGYRPRMVVVIGDTNSTLGATLAAVKSRIPVVHVEAGLRAQDAHMAEEINRRMVDAVADILCAPSRATAARLERERPEAAVVDTGDVARDVLRGIADRLPDPAGVLPETVRGPFIYATLHRAELTDDRARLEGALRALESLDMPAVLPLHPRTRDVLGLSGSLPVKRGGLHLIPAVGYLESIACTRAARAVVTDSGGVQREAYWLGTPCVTLRHETEWSETVDSGANRLADPAHPETLAAAVREQLARWEGSTWDATAYGTGEAAARIGALVAARLETAS